MIQTKELFHLKSLVSERKVRENSFTKLSLELWCLTSLIVSIPLSIFGYVLVTWTSETYLFEILGIAYGLYFLGWVLTPLAGRKMGEFLDFSALIHMPIGRVKLFALSLGTSLMDVAVLPIFPILWGVSIALGALNGWWWIPVLMAANLLFLITCLAFSQAAFLTHHLVLRRTRWFPFLFSLIVPAAVFLGGAYVYLSIIVSLPLFDLFSKPDVGFLASTYLIPTSAFLLWLKASLAGDWLTSIPYLSIFLMELLCVLFAGAWLVHKVQRGETHKDLAKAGGEWFYGGFRMVLGSLLRLPSTLVTMIEKDFKLLLREPETKTHSFFHILVPVFLFCLLYGLAFVASELSVASESGRFFEFYRSFASFPFKPDEVLHAWPLFFCVALFVIASELGSNLFGMERFGIQQLMLLSVPSWQIILSKNLAILCFVLIPIGILYGLGALLGLHSIHSLHAVWLYFIIGVFFLFIGGNFLSILFPIRVDSSVSASLHRDTFSRRLGLVLTKLITSSLIFFVSFPIFLECIYPLWNAQGYFSPFIKQDFHALVSGVRVVKQVWPSHGMYTLYALGAYFLSLFCFSAIFDARKEKLFLELGQRET